MAVKLEDYLKELDMKVASSASAPETAGKNPMRKADTGAGKGDMLLTSLMTAHNQFKIFHWQTKFFSQHEAFGKIYESLGENMDEFIETYMGRYQRIYASNGRFLIKLDNYSESYLAFVDAFIYFLRDELPTCLGPEDTDLLNIRDEILGNVNQLKYLLTFR
jgi:hypothetical protein